MTLRPCRCKGRMTLLQQEPSAHAPCTRMIAESLGKTFISKSCFLWSGACLVSRIARVRVRILFEGRASGAASGQWSFRKGAQGAAGLDRGSHESEDAGVGSLLLRLLIAVPK
jgi:hypothetical protein